MATPRGPESGLPRTRFGFRRDPATLSPKEHAQYLQSPGQVALAQQRRRASELARQRERNAKKESDRRDAAHRRSVEHFADRVEAQMPKIFEVLSDFAYSKTGSPQIAFDTDVITAVIDDFTSQSRYPSIERVIRIGDEFVFPKAPGFPTPEIDSKARHMDYVICGYPWDLYGYKQEQSQKRRWWRTRSRLNRVTLLRLQPFYDDSGIIALSVFDQNPYATSPETQLARVLQKHTGIKTFATAGLIKPRPPQIPDEPPLNEGTYGP